MQVKVFVAIGESLAQNQLLILPADPITAIPKEVGDGWTYFDTVNRDGLMLGLEPESIEADIAAQGYSLIETSR